MKEHFDEGVMQALLDGELGDEEASVVRAHIGACAICGAGYQRVEQAASTLSDALQLLDQHDRPLPGTVEKARASRYVVPLWLPKAAVILLVAVAAASATMPGSPIRGWLVDRFEEPEAVPTTAAIATVEQPAETPVEPAPPAPPLERGVSTEPASGQFRIYVRGTAPIIPIHAVLTDSPLGGAYSIGEAHNTRFAMARGVVEVFEPEGDELRLEDPRSAVAASVEINGRTYIVKDGDALRLIMERDSLGTEFRFQPLP